MSIEENKQAFQLYVKHSTPETYELNKDGTLTITGIASTTNKDLQGDVILPECIESMKKQLTTSSKNLHGDHRYGLFDGIIGVIQEVIDSDEHTLKIKSVIRSKFASEIKEMLEIGINLGFSIGGNVTDYNPVKDGWEIKDISLREISLTAMPANWDSYGSVTIAKGIVHANCLAGACHVIRKNFMNEGENMSEQNNNNSEAAFTQEDAVNLFNELMAAKQEEIAEETLNKMEKRIDSMIDEKIEAALRNKEPKDDEGADEDDDKDESKSLNATELKSLLSETVAPMINDAVKSSMDANMSTLFKNLNDNRDPNFKVDATKNVDPKEDVDDVNEALTSKQIAENMFKASSVQDEVIASLLNKEL